MAVSITGAGDLDRAIENLRQGAGEWARLDFQERIEVLAAIRPLIVRYANEWVSAALAAKGIPPDSALAGEEWLSGPFAVLYAINRYIRTLHDLAQTGAVALPGPVRVRADGQKIAGFSCDVLRQAAL